MLPKHRVDEANKITISKKKSNNKRKTTEQYKEELAIYNPNVEVLEEYINAKTKILHKYKSCGHIESVVPDRILRGSGCKICYRKNIGERTKKDTNKYKEELISKNINVEVLEEYIDAITPILHKFTCNHINKVSPSSILRGSKCLQCNNIKLGDSRRKSQTQYINEVHRINPTINILGNYINANNHIQVQCSICSHIWSPIAGALVKKNPTGCPKCAGQIVTSSDFYNKFEKYGNKDIVLTGKYINSTTKINGYCKKCKNNISMYPYQLIRGVRCKQCVSLENGLTLRKTQEQFINELANINKNIKVLGKYYTAKDSIKVQCTICNHIWNPVAHLLLVGTGCPRCTNHYTISHEKFIKKVRNTKNKNIDIIGKYVNTKTPIECICKECGNIFSSIPHQIEIGNGCKKCADKKRGLASRKSYDIFISEVKLQNPNVEIIGEYITSHDHIETKCLLCGTIWTPIADSLLRGNGCPCCKSSKLESKVEYYLKNNNMEYIHPAKFDNLIGVGGRHLSYDFHLPQYNLLIECQGAQHERPVEYFGGIKKFVIQKIHDTRKRKYAHDNNINLLEIWYYEENKIDKILTQTLNNLKSESVETVIPA